MSAEAGLSWSEVLLVLLMALISALTVVGNLVVLLSFALDRQIRQPSNFFIFSLAVSDLVGMQWGKGGGGKGTHNPILGCPNMGASSRAEL